MQLAEDVRAEADQVLAEAHAARIRLARRYPARFCEHVLRDERWGTPIQLAPMHEEWHQLLNDERRSIIWSHVEAGKTSQLAVGRPLYELGRDRNKRIVIAGNTQGQAAKAVRSISTYIERSSSVHEVFPELKPGLPWTQTQLTVQRTAISKDPSVQALGVHGQVIGGRIDWLLVDDILDFENTRSEQHCEELIYWYRSEIVGRLTRDARVAFIGNAYVPKDLLHVLAAEGVYKTRTYSVMNDNGLPRWPEQWPPERIAEVTKELGGEGHPEVARQLYCVPRSEGSSRCQEAWMQQCLERGLGIELLDGLSEADLVELGGAAGPCRVHIGVDIGIKKHKRAGKSVVFGLLVWPDLRDKQVIWCKSGRWSGPQIVTSVLDAQRRFCGQAHVEDNGAQDFILQMAHGTFTMPTDGADEGEQLGDAGASLLVLPFHTGGNKTHPTIGVESVFVELARGEWIIPAVEGPEVAGQAKKLLAATPELQEWVTESLAYSPERHTGDHLMASWFAKEGARLAGTQRPKAGVNIVGDDVTDSNKVGRGHPKDFAGRLAGWEAMIRKGRSE